MGAFMSLDPETNDSCLDDCLSSMKNTWSSHVVPWITSIISSKKDEDFYLDLSGLKIAAIFKKIYKDGGMDVEIYHSFYGKQNTSRRYLIISNQPDVDSDKIIDWWINELKLTNQYLLLNIIEDRNPVLIAEVIHPKVYCPPVKYKNIDNEIVNEHSIRYGNSEIIEDHL